jgi:small subunit ribosomal protein S16
MLARDHAQRVSLIEERIKHWMKQGAQPSERVAKILHAANLGPKVAVRSTPKKSAPKAKTQERLKLAAEAAEAAAKAAQAASEAPAVAAEEAPAEAAQA